MRKTSERLRAIGMKKPGIVVDRRRALSNIQRMTQRAAGWGLSFRPHFKTHQSREIGEWFRDAGVDRITVSSVDMAEYFAGSGWKDIHIAFVANLIQWQELNDLADVVNLTLLVDSGEAVRDLEGRLERPVNVRIKIDTGYGRTGILWNDASRIAETAERIRAAEDLTFDGLLSHNGETYHAKSRQEVLELHDRARKRLFAAREALNSLGMDPCPISVGDTPSCSLAEAFDGLDEIRPGNFVFYDLMQHRLGSCGEEEIAAFAACPVVGKYAEPRRIVIYGGAVHLGKEALRGPHGRSIYGCMARIGEGDTIRLLQENVVTGLTQEHGILEVDDEVFDQVHPGDVVLIVPVHSCLTCDLHSEYRSLDGGFIPRLP